MVYKCPGPLERAGGTYAQMCVEDDAKFVEAIDSGWHQDMLDAINPPEPQATEDNGPATRAEMEIKAKDIGLKFDGRTSNARLLKMIEEAIRGAA